MKSNFTDLKRKDMIKQIEGLKKYTDCSMPITEKQRIEKAECTAYNQAIEDVVKLFSIHNVVGQSEQLQGFFDFYKKKFGGGFNTDVLEITLKQYKETL